MTRTPQDLCHALLDAARTSGAEAADAIVMRGQSVSVQVRGGALEHAERSEATDLGLRVLIGRRQAVVSTSDARAATLSDMAERAVAMARETPEDPFAGLADPGRLAQDRDAGPLDLCDPAPEPSPEDLKADALAAEAAAMAVKGVSQVSDADAGYGVNQVWLAASNGFSGGYGRSTRWISTQFSPSSCSHVPAGLKLRVDDRRNCSRAASLASISPAREVGVPLSSSAVSWSSKRMAIANDAASNTMSS